MKRKAKLFFDILIFFFDFLWFSMKGPLYLSSVLLLILLVFVYVVEQ